MTRRDWAWLMACAVCGFLLVLFTIVPEAIYDHTAHYGTSYTVTTSDDGKTVSEKMDRFVVPTYTQEVTFRTNSHAQEIIQTVNKLHLSDVDISLKHIGPETLTFFDFLTFSLTAFFAFVLATRLFAILEKICGRILGLKPLSEPI